MGMFGSLNLKGIVGSVLGSRAGVVVLFKLDAGMRTTGRLTNGSNPAATSYACRGYVSDYATSLINGTDIAAGDRCLVVYASTLPAGVEPLANDRVTVDGATYTIVRLEDRDPAGVRYVCQVR